MKSHLDRPMLLPFLILVNGSNMSDRRQLLVSALVYRSKKNPARTGAVDHVTKEAKPRQIYRGRVITLLLENCRIDSEIS